MTPLWSEENIESYSFIVLHCVLNLLQSGKHWKNTTQMTHKKDDVEVIVCVGSTKLWL